MFSFLSDVVYYWSKIVDFILPLLILIYGFYPTFDLRKLIKYILLIILILPINFLITFFTSWFLGSIIILRLYLISIIPAVFFIYKRNYYLAFIMPKCIDIILVLIGWLFFYTPIN